MKKFAKKQRINATIIAIFVFLMNVNIAVAQEPHRKPEDTLSPATQPTRNLVPVNPYEQVGKDHNAGLRAVLNQLKIRDKKEDKKAAKARADRVMSEWLRTYMQSKNESARLSRPVDSLVRQASSMLQDPLPPFDPIKECGPVAGEAYKELMRIAQSASSIAELDERVHAVEARLLRYKNDKGVPPVLMSAAVLRNSAHFWVEEYPRSMGSLPEASARIKWGKIFVQDGAGAVIGGIFGGPGGAVGGGLGASIGAFIDEVM